MSENFNDLSNNFPQNNEPTQTVNTQQFDRQSDDKAAYTSATPADAVFTTPYQPTAQANNTDNFNNRSWNAQPQSVPDYKVTSAQTYSDNSNKEKKPKKNKNGVSKGFVAFMLILCIILSSAIGFGGALLYTNMTDKDDTKDDAVKKTEVSENGALVINTVDIDEQTAAKLSDKSTSAITDEVADTVVEITTEVMSTSLFYGQYISQGAGSGVIISSDGYIVTNNHVIEGASSITVTLRDKTTYEAELVGTDSVIDIALLKIDAKNLKTATFGDSDKLKVGNKAVAIGNPLGQLGGSVTDGIISALDREIVVGDETMNLLQTDTAINPGNSGGGLFDGQGLLIGIVVAKQTGEEIEGLGFAIPINDVIEVVDDLKEYGYVRGRVALGVELFDVANSKFSMYYYGTDTSGCFVYSVVPGSSADDAGMTEGDRIVSIDGTEITVAADVEAILDDKSVGDELEVVIERDGKEKTLTVTLEEYVPDAPDSTQA